MNALDRYQMNLMLDCMLASAKGLEDAGSAHAASVLRDYADRMRAIVDKYRDHPGK